MHHVAVVEHIVHRADARLFLEVFHRVRGNVVIPVIDVHAGFGRLGGLGAGQADTAQRGQDEWHVASRFHRDAPEHGRRVQGHARCSC
ncbi:hypothetical protein D3C85_1658100 [compost metagenome]